MTTGKICHPPLPACVAWCDAHRDHQGDRLCHPVQAPTPFPERRDIVEIRDQDDAPPDPKASPPPREPGRLFEPLEPTREIEIEPPLRIEVYPVVTPTGSLIDVFM